MGTGGTLLEVLWGLGLPRRLIRSPRPAGLWLSHGLFSFGMRGPPTAGRRREPGRIRGTMMANTVKVAVTKAVGAVARDLLPRIVAGEMFGPERRVALSLHDEPGAAPAPEEIAAGLRDVGPSVLEE